LISFREGALDAKDIYQEILVQILGTREEGLLKKASQFDMEAIQVLNLFKYADRSVTKHILEGKSEEKEMLTTCYKFLCEFCHPNFHSNLVAYELIKEQNKFRFLYDKKVADRDFGVVGHLLISNPLFIEFFDKVETLIPQG
jgi:hypothetical protein